MKLVVVTAVEAFQNDVLRLFKTANIQSFSSSEIDGHKNKSTILSATNWFSSGKNGAESSLFFSFTEEAYIDDLFQLIKAYNANLETNNPVKAIVVPVEKFI